MTAPPKEHLAFALDVHRREDAQRWVSRLSNTVGVFKVGLELFTAVGPDAIKLVHDAGSHCFLDLKLHDIPATTARAVAAAAGLGVRYLTVHAAAGPAALKAAVEAAGDTRLLAVTVLTSLDDGALKAIGMASTPGHAAERLSSLAEHCGVHGFVTSARECDALRRALSEHAFLVVPGIRPQGTATDDQRRVATPASAIASGADLLVVGRPIRNASDPIAAAQSIVEEIERAQAR